MQHEVIKRQKLLNGQGHVAEPGWARHPVWMYDRRDIKAPKIRVKEWDYYMAMNDRFAAAFTISDLGYAGMVSVSVLDLTGPREHTETVLVPLTMGRLGLRASSASGDVDFKNRRVHLRCTLRGVFRHIQCVFHAFEKGETLKADLLIRQPAAESMCIATPWAENPKCFYYNQKINCMPVNGVVSVGSREYRFRGSQDMAVLDWGRGVWTYDNTWYWGTASTRIDGEPFGINLGYGFSDRSSATENAVFYRGKIHKLGQVTFDIPRRADGSPDDARAWTISSDDGRFEAIFVPVLDRSALIDLKAFSSSQHQVFGHLTGTAILDDGSEIKMRDMMAALEEVHNRY